MRMYDIIEKKRDGGELSREELKFFVNGYTSGEIPDYQASALLMAIFIRGMNSRETSDLTLLMANSGDSIDLSSINGIKVDKHSTGGVGDKTTLVLAPVVAACGVPVAKMSGRGLGHTGGTIDKLESIKGFRTSISREEFLDNVRSIGLCIAGQTGNLAPADKKIYALRDVTATVNSIPLIASSIMSKKLAAGAQSILLDVKTGSGAFMKNLEESIELAEAMVEIGEKLGRRTAAVITDMDVPLGNAIGNSLEVIEAIETLKGRGPEDFTLLSLELAARMLELAGKGSLEQCREKAYGVISDGSALERFSKLIALHGGDSRVINDYSLFDRAEKEYCVTSDDNGYVYSIRADMLGIAAMVLGAGRETKDDTIDHSAGLILEKKPGMKVRRGDILARIYTNRNSVIDEATGLVKKAYAISDKMPVLRPIILSEKRFDHN